MARTSPARRARSREAAPLTADARPHLAGGVAFEEITDDAVCIVLVHGVPSSRVSPAVVHLLTAMDGEKTLLDLHRLFAASEPWESFLELAQRFRASGLLDSSTTPPPGRLTYRPPFTLQIATLRAPAIFHALDRVMVGPSRRVLVVSIGALVGLGLLAAAMQTRDLLVVVTMPVPLVDLVVLAVVLAFLTLLHELAHGLALTRFGGSPRRAGFMLFYLTPAFFVDVTDGWRLSDRRQRVAIALAGPAVHAVVAAVGLLLALVVPESTLRRMLLLLALSCGAVVVVNLIPFVRFDGYIALMSALDEPNLRVRTIRDGVDSLTRVLFGGPRRSRNLDRWWSVPFGLASLVAPVVLVLFAVTRTARALAGGGPVLGLLVVALEAVVVLVGIAILLRGLRRVLRAGVSQLRFLSVSTALFAAIIVAGALIPVPLTATLGFIARGDRVLLVRAGDDAAAEVPAGARVELLNRGILVDQAVGDGRAVPQTATRTPVPLDALLPVTASGVSAAAVIIAEVDVSAKSGVLPPRGEARVELDSSTLWQALWETGVIMPLSAFQTERRG